MAFLNPLALWLLLIVPIVFLARRRPARQRVPVANLYLWKVAAPSGASALTWRFRRHRLFLLQALALVALIFAMARPLWPFGTHAVVVIDVSLSMSARDGARTRLDVAKTQAVSFAEGLPWSAHVRVITAAAAPQDLGEFRVSDPALRRALETVRPSLESSDLDAAIQLARSLDEPPDHIEVFSDLASPIPPGAPSDVVWSQIGRPNDNVALTALGVLRRPREAYVSASVTNFGGAVVTRTVVLEQAGRTLARDSLEIAPGRTRTVNAIAGLVDGAITARIDGDDALTEDNQRRAIVPPTRRLRVLLTGGAFFLEQALRTYPGVEVTVGPSSGASDVIVCAACSELPAGNTSVLFIPSSGDALNPVPMTSNAIGHPLLDGIELADLSIAPVAIGRALRDGTVVATAGNVPAMVAYGSEGRRVVEWRFNVSNGALPLSPAFPLLVANALEWLTLDRQNPESVLAATESDLRVIKTASVPSSSGERRNTDRSPGVRDEITALLLVLALGALVAEWQHRRGTLGKAATVSRWVVVTCVVIAAAGLRIRGGTAPVSVMFVLDRSDSVSASQSDSLERVRKLSEAMRSGDRAGLVVFGADAVVERGLTSGFRPQAVNAVVRQTGTNIEAALRSARIGLASAESARIVLLSDGRETRGDALAEAARSALAAIPIDVAAVSIPRSSAPRVVQLHAPAVVRIDEPFIVLATVRGAPGTTCNVTLQSEEDGPIEQKVVLSAYGVGTASFTGRSRQAGVRAFRAVARSVIGDALSDVQESPVQAGATVVVAGVPRLLYVSATGRPAVSVGAAGFQVSSTMLLPRSVAQLDQYDAIVLDDVRADALDAAQTGALAEYVEKLGGGLFMLGSPRSLEPGLVANTSLDRLLPIDVRPRSGQRSDDLALVMIVDKSGSMDDPVAGARKIDFARQSIQRALESVSATDSVGVIAFDAVAVPVAPLRPGQDSRAIDERLRSIAPGGSTAIAPAVELARDWLRAAPVDAARRHVLLISDGQTSIQDAARLRDLVAARGFTLSVVALGGDRDRQQLTSLSQSSGGQAFFPEDIRQVPTLVAREVTRVTGGRLVQVPFVVRPSTHPVLSGIETDAWPQLGGYVVSAVPPGAEAPLRSHLDDPVLATWRIGLGRVGVYTADLSSPWSDRLRAWRGFDQLMGQTVRWLSRRVDDDSLSVRMLPTDDGVRVVVESYGPDDAPLNLADVHATLARPSGAIEPLDLSGILPGRYEAAVIAGETGAHTITVDAASSDRTFERHLTRGFDFSGEREYRNAGIDRDMLDAIARATGGAVLGPTDSPFARPRPATYFNVRPWLVIAALVIFLGELLLPGLAERLRARRAAAVETGRTAGREDAA